MKKKKTILMLASVASMIDQFNMQNIRLLLEMGYAVSVACNFYAGNTCDRKRIRKLVQTLRKLDVTYYQWDCPRNIVPLTACLRAYRQLTELTDKHSFAWIHCHSPVGGVLARLVAHQKGIRVIYTAHGFHFYKGAPLKNWLLYYPAEKLLSYWTDVLITVNWEDYRFAKHHLCPGQLYHIPGVGIDTDRFAKKVPQKRVFRRKYQIPNDAVLLLSVGELSNRKNHRAVINAMAELSMPDLYYLVCGQGPCDSKLRKQADMLGIGECVKLAGYQEDLEEFYVNADIFVFPSVQEGLPAALMEAMAAGLPCIVSDIRGNRELIGWNQEMDGMHDNVRDIARVGGIRFLLKQPEQLGVAIARMVQDQKLRQVCGIYNQKKMKGYDKKVVDRQMWEIYKNASLAVNCIKLSE